MAYFSNGSEGDNYTSQYCDRCVNWRDMNDGRGAGCPVWDIHLLYAYEECNNKGNAKAILDTLIPMNPKTHFAEQCAMFQPNARTEQRQP